MPANPRSLLVTDTYRTRLLTLRGEVLAAARRGWGMIDPADLDRGHGAWVAANAVLVEGAQRAGVRLTAAYLGTYVALELRQAPTIAPLAEEPYAGRARDGRPLADALAPSLFTVKTAIADGKPVDQALTEGLARAARVAGAEAMAAPRAALHDEVDADERIDGWRRVTAGGCGACLAAATDTYGPDEPLLVHDSCRCTAEPVIAGVRDTAQRPTGPELFDAMTAAEQDQALGPAAAEAIRTGQTSFPDLIAISPMKEMADQLTQAPLGALP